MNIKMTSLIQNKKESNRLLLFHSLVISVWIKE